MTTQNNIILAYMQEHGSIDVAQAFELCHTTRLSARIFDLRERGYVISAQPISGRNTITGNAWNSVRYVLEQKNVQ